MKNEKPIKFVNEGKTAEAINLHNEVLTHDPHRSATNTAHALRARHNWPTLSDLLAREN
jgi:hypothetical protein